MVNINIKDYVFEHMGQENNVRTTNRLNELIKLGFEVTGYASFGYKNVLSGLYIERVWSWSDEEWVDYINWAKDLIKEKL